MNGIVVGETRNSKIDAMLLQERQHLEEQQRNLIKQLNEFIQKLNSTLISIGNRKRKSTDSKEHRDASQAAEPKGKLQKMNATSLAAFFYKQVIIFHTLVRHHETFFFVNTALFIKEIEL